MCHRVEVPGFGSVIVCGGHTPRRHCVHCRASATRLCDHRNSDGRTCSAPICDACAFHVSARRDYCQFHAATHLHEARPRLPFDEPPCAT